MEIQINKSINILLVDDEPFILGFTSRILNSLGYENISTAKDGSNALLKLVMAKKNFDLIVCDINMPEMDGVEFMRRAKEARYLGGFILLSGEDSQMLEAAYGFAKTQNLNILGAIAKPLDREVFEKLLNTVGSPEQATHIGPDEIPIDEEELKRGIRGLNSDELLMLYQAKVEVTTGKIVGAEALARWNHAARGILAPIAFFPLAGHSGLMDELNQKIYKKIVLQVAEWRDAGILLNASINFPASSIEDPEFCDYMVSVCKESKVDPSQIVLQISEGEVAQQSAEFIEALMRLRLKRFSISIDKFGSGNSSIAGLSGMPVTELKVDKGFVSGAVNNAGGRAALDSSVALAKNLNMQVVAEGAQTREDWELAVELGVDYVQGSYISKPIPNSELIGFLQNWTGPIL